MPGLFAVRRRPGFGRLGLMASCVVLACAAYGQVPTPSPSKASASAVPARAPLHSGPAWSALTAQQRAALAPLERDWAGIDGPRKTKWLEVAARFPAMNPDEQRRIQERMADWARMTPTQRGQARLAFQEAKQLSPQDRHARWEAYQALPEDQRKALAERSRAASAPPPTSASHPAQVVTKAVAPTLLQVKPGATTQLMSRSATPPAHHQPGQPKIAVQPDEVNRSTLLPQKGPQAAATAAAPASRQP